MINITCSEDQDSKFSQGNWITTVRNLLGQAVISKPYEPTLNVTGLNDGFYLVEIKNPSTGHRFAGKLIIGR
jgi:hypothetical protein